MYYTIVLDTKAIRPRRAAEQVTGHEHGFTGYLYPPPHRYRGQGRLSDDGGCHSGVAVGNAKLLGHRRPGRLNAWQSNLHSRWHRAKVEGLNHPLPFALVSFHRIRGLVGQRHHAPVILCCCG
jgi:hypothetical protein